MTTTTILVWTSAKSAVLHSCQHGWHALHVDTSTLSDAQRTLLAARIHERDGARYVQNPHYNNPIPCDVAPPTIEGLIAHLQDTLDSEAEKAREAEAEHKRNDLAISAALETARTCPVADLVDRGHYGPRLTRIGSYCNAKTTHYLPESAFAERWGGHEAPIAEIVGRMAEAEAELARILAEQEQAEGEREAERERAKAERVAQTARNRAKLREILLMHAADIVPVFDDGKARPSDIERGVEFWACEQLGIDPDVRTDYAADTLITAHTYTPEEWHAWKQVSEKAPAALGDPNVDVTIYRLDDADDEVSVVGLTADVAGVRIYLEIPIEHAQPPGNG